MAFNSIVCMTYFTMMTLSMTSLAWYGILPNIFKSDFRQLFRHKCFTGFVFSNAVGNCILCLVTNTSVRKFLTRSKSKDVTGTEAECEHCKSPSPPRSHHCPMCETCILKRDHHCFFMTVCIGYHNQKYFILYCFYMLLGTFYAVFLIVKYLKVFYNVRFYGPQTFIFLFIETFMKFFTKADNDNLYLFMIVMLFGSLSAGLLVGGLWFWQMLLTFSGQSTFEASRNIRKYSSSKYRNFIDVFGKYWLLSIFIPLPLPQCSDGMFSNHSKSWLLC